MKKNKVVLVLVVLIPIIAALFYFYYWANLPFKEIEKVVKRLKTEREVIEAFGSPSKTFYKGSQDYYVEGYSHKKREIQNKVMIYFPKNPTDIVTDIILYIYIDNNGQIEDYFIGGS